MSRHMLRRAIKLNNLQEVERILENAGSQSDDVINDFAADDCLLDVVFCNTQKESPIFDAIRSGNTRMVEVLIEHGCDLTCRDRKHGASVVHACALQKNVAMLELILNHTEPDVVNKTDRNGRTALHYLSMETKKNPGNETLQILKLLISRMDTNTVTSRDCKNKTCEDYAMANSNTWFIEALH